MTTARENAERRARLVAMEADGGYHVEYGTLRVHYDHIMEVTSGGDVIAYCHACRAIIADADDSPEGN